MHSTFYISLSLSLLVTRVLADDSAYHLALTVATNHETAVFADGLGRGANLHGRNEILCRSVGRVGRSLCRFYRLLWLLSIEGKRLIRAITVDNTTFLEIIGGHFDLNPISREDTNAVDPHATSERAVQFVVFGLWTQYSDAERSIGKRFFDNADEFDNIL